MLFTGLFKILGLPSQGPAGGDALGEVDLVRRSVRINTHYDVKPIAAAYSILATDTGKVFVVTAAATLTLPANSAALKGCWVKVIIGADVSVTIAATAGELVAFNDVAANSIAFSTSGEKAGNAVDFISDGTKWYACVQLGAETATPTIAT